MKITYKTCRDNLGDCSDDQYSRFKSCVAIAIQSEYPDAQVFVGDSGFANTSEISVSANCDVFESLETNPKEIESIANRVFNSGCWF